MFVYGASYLVFVASVTQTTVFRVSCCLEYILHVTVRLFGIVVCFGVQVLPTPNRIHVQIDTKSAFSTNSNNTTQNNNRIDDFGHNFCDQSHSVL